MRKEIREITITQPKTIYIAKDGKEFMTESACHAYEFSLLTEEPEVIQTAIRNVVSFYEEYPAIIYHIKSEKDWVILKDYIWHNNMDGEYIGAGDYIAIEKNMGDYEPEYTICFLQNYCMNIMRDATEYYNYIQGLLNT